MNIVSRCMLLCTKISTHTFIHPAIPEIYRYERNQCLPHLGLEQNTSMVLTASKCVSICIPFVGNSTVLLHSPLCSYYKLYLIKNEHCTLTKINMDKPMDDKE